MDSVGPDLLHQISKMFMDYLMLKWIYLLMQKTLPGYESCAEGGIRRSICIDAALPAHVQISGRDLHGKAFLECSRHEATPPWAVPVHRYIEQKYMLNLNVNSNSPYLHPFQVKPAKISKFRQLQVGSSHLSTVNVYTNHSLNPSSGILTKNAN